ncbi:MAG: signal peptidase I [Planctomycetota bacterium]|jgi:signal peptidase I
MNAPSDHRPSPLTAALLSCLCTGLGQMYCGRVARGLGFLVASLLFAPVVLVAASNPPSTPWLVAQGIGVLVFVVVALVSIVDAALLARGPRPPRSRRSIAPVVAAGLVALGMCYPVGATEYLRENVYEMFLIPTRSMAPTLLPGDRVLVDRSHEARTAPRRGDLVAFEPPGQAEALYVKRLVALPGERVALRDGELLIDGVPVPRFPMPPVEGEAAPDRTPALRYVELLDERPHDVFVCPGTPRADFRETLVPPGSVFVLGDNRDGSLDSRDFGPVPFEALHGVARYLIDLDRLFERSGALGPTDLPADYARLLEARPQR